MGSQADMFVEIWEALEPEQRVSFVTGMILPTPHEMRAYYFAHVLGKGNYPRFKLKKENIRLLTFKEHKLWDTARFKIKENPNLLKMWKPMFKLEEKLIEEYYAK